MRVKDHPEPRMEKIWVKCSVCNQEQRIPVDPGVDSLELGRMVVSWRCLSCLNHPKAKSQSEFSS